jgi:hypothetical protein
MTENYSPPLETVGYPDPPPAPPTLQQPESSAGTKDVAKQQASSVGHGAAEAGQHVAGVAKQQGSEVVSEAGRQARDLAQQAQGQLREQAGMQQQKLAGSLRSLSDELRSMASNNEQPGVATDLAREASQRTGALAGWLDGREPSDVVDEVTRFARRRPGAFLAAAAGIGFLAGRLTRGLQAQASGSDSSGTTGRPGYPPPASALPPPTGYAPAPSAYPYPEVPPVPPVTGLSDPIDGSVPVAPVTPQTFPSAGYLGENR